MWLLSGCWANDMPGLETEYGSVTRRFAISIGNTFHSQRGEARKQFANCGTMDDRSSSLGRRSSVQMDFGLPTVQLAATARKHGTVALAGLPLRRAAEPAKPSL